MFDRVRPVYRSELCILAYAKKQPIGVVLAFPDNTPYLQALKGSPLPWRMLSALSAAKRLHTARCPIQYVIPEYQNKAVNLAMLCRAFENAQRIGIQRIEGSLVDELNAVSLNNSQLFGGKAYKTYRIYQKSI